MNACRLGHGHRAGGTDQVGSLSAGGEADEGLHGIAGGHAVVDDEVERLESSIGGRVHEVDHLHLLVADVIDDVLLGELRARLLEEDLQSVGA